MRPSEVLRRSTEYLSRHGVQSPRETAETLLMHFLGTDRAGLYSRVEGLDTQTAKAFGRALCQRCRGTPVQHLTRRQEFMDLSLLVMPDVFIPRPETEGLVLAALEALTDTPEPLVVDAATGSGAVALAIKHRRRDARVFATDSSLEAVSVAVANSARLALEIDVRHGDLLSPLPPGLRRSFDLVVSNPPYVTEEEYESLPEEVKAEPYEALVGGTDVHRRLAEEARSWLKPGGSLVMEIGEAQGGVLRALLSGLDAEVEVLPDLAGRDRVVRARLP